MWFWLITLLAMGVMAFVGDATGRAFTPMRGGRLLGYLIGIPALAFVVGTIAGGIEDSRCDSSQYECDLSFVATVVWGLGTLVIGFASALAFEVAAAIRRRRTP